MAWIIKKPSNGPYEWDYWDGAGWGARADAKVFTTWADARDCGGELHLHLRVNPKGYSGVELEDVTEETKAMLKWRVTNLKGVQFVVTDLQLGDTWLAGCESNGAGLRWRTENVARVERIQNEWVLRWDHGDGASQWVPKVASVNWAAGVDGAMRFPDEGAALRYREVLYRRARELEGPEQMRAAAQIVALMLKAEEVEC